MLRMCDDHDDDNNDDVAPRQKQMSIYSHHDCGSTKKSGEFPANHSNCIIIHIKMTNRLYRSSPKPT